jgi:hypothetical protein
MLHCFAAFISVAAIMPQALASGKAPWMRRACGHSCDPRIFRKAEWAAAAVERGLFAVIVCPHTERPRRVEWRGRQTYREATQCPLRMHNDR